MKKIITLLFVLAFVCISCSSKNEESKVEGQPKSTQTSKEDVTEPPQTTDNDLEDKEENKETTKPITRKQKSGLVQISMCYSSAGCSTEDGYYYISKEWENDLPCFNICYVDYAKKQESYLCKEKGCKHRGVSCTSCIDEELDGGRGMLFTVQNKLYLLVNYVDKEGALVYGSESGNTTDSNKGAILYSMNMDGTNIKEVYNFEAGETVGDKIYYDGEKLFMEVDKLAAESIKTDCLYMKAEKKKIISLSVKDYQRKTVKELEPDQKVAGCTPNYLVLVKEEVDGKYTQAQIATDKSVEAEAMKTQIISFFKLDLKTKEQSNVKQLTEKGIKSYAVENNTLYYAVEDSGEIKAVNIEDGSERVLAKTEYESIIGSTDEVLICRSCKLGSTEPGCVINLANGKAHDLQLLIDQKDAVDIVGSNPSQYLVINNATDQGQQKFCLININSFIDQQEKYEEIPVSSKGIITNFDTINQFAG